MPPLRPQTAEQIKKEIDTKIKGITYFPETIKKAIEAKIKEKMNNIQELVKLKSLVERKILDRWTKYAMLEAHIINYAKTALNITAPVQFILEKEQFILPYKDSSISFYFFEEKNKLFFSIEYKSFRVTKEAHAFLSMGPQRKDVILRPLYALLNKQKNIDTSSLEDPLKREIELKKNELVDLDSIISNFNAIKQFSDFVKMLKESGINFNVLKIEMNNYKNFFIEIDSTKKIKYDHPFVYFLENKYLPIGWSSGLRMTETEENNKKIIKEWVEKIKENYPSLAIFGATPSSPTPTASSSSSGSPRAAAPPSPSAPSPSSAPTAAPAATPQENQLKNELATLLGDKYVKNSNLLTFEGDRRYTIIPKGNKILIYFVGTDPTTAPRLELTLDDFKKIFIDNSGNKDLNKLKNHLEKEIFEKLTLAQQRTVLGDRYLPGDARPRSAADYRPVSVPAATVTAAPASSASAAAAPTKAPTASIDSRARMPVSDSRIPLGNPIDVKIDKRNPAQEEKKEKQRAAEQDLTKEDLEALDYMMRPAYLREFEEKALKNFSIKRTFDFSEDAGKNDFRNYAYEKLITYLGEFSGGYDSLADKHKKTATFRCLLTENNDLIFYREIGGKTEKKLQIYLFVEGRILSSNKPDILTTNIVETDVASALIKLERALATDSAAKQRKRNSSDIAKLMNEQKTRAKKSMAEADKILNYRK